MILFVTGLMYRSMVIPWQGKFFVLLGKGLLPCKKHLVGHIRRWIVSWIKLLSEQKYLNHV